MELLPTAYFLIPGVFALTTHRFASAQPLSAGSQIAWTVIYSAMTYLLLQSPLGSWIRTTTFPAALFQGQPGLLNDPESSIRLVGVSLAAAVVGLLVGRAVSSNRSHRAVSVITGRNLHATVWIEAFRNAPRQWVRLTNGEFDLIGWLESASDGPTERSLILSNVFRHGKDGSRTAVPGGLLLVDAAKFDTIVLLGKDVASAYAAARQRVSNEPGPAAAGRPGPSPTD
jgi:hypothetical protein